MRLTSRGWAVAGLVVAAMGLAALFGPRALNAVAAPLLAALGLGLWQVSRADTPAVTLAAVPPGHPGERRTLSFSIEGSGIAAVEADLPAGLGGGTLGRTVSMPASIDTRVDLAARGIYDFEHLSVRQRDALGLVESARRPDLTERVLVYPTVYPLRGDRRLEQLFADVSPPERQEFERLREYVAGDPLRHVHWKSSAKYDDYLVMEFAPTRRNETVSIVADGSRAGIDEMASAAASLVVAAVAAGLGVEVTVPAGHLPEGQGEAHRRNALRLLATTGPGTVPRGEHEDADVSIRTDGSGTSVRLGRTEVGYGDLVAGKQPERARPRVVA
ncbi:MAG: DUF58 domain-containing protein [Haloarculaceae archaeon]